MGKLVDLQVWWWECHFLFCRKNHADCRNAIFIGPFLSERSLVSWKRSFLRELRILCKKNNFELMNFPGKTTAFIDDKTYLVEPVRATWVAEGFYYFDFDEKRVSRP